MRQYRNLFQIPQVKRLVASAIPGRLAYGMINISTYFYVYSVTHSITTAGLATGAETVTSSLTAGFRGGLIDRYGQTRPLSCFVPLWATCVVVLSTQHNPTLILINAAIVGLFSPPINLSTRPLWRVAVGAENLRTAYALDTTMSSTTVIVGPVLATWLALNISGALALRMTASIMIIGGISLITMPLSRNWNPDVQAASAMSIIRHRGLQMLAIEGMVFGLGWGLLDISIPATATLNKTPHVAAPLLAILAASSIIGGLVLGSRKSDITPLSGFKRSSVAVALSTLPLPFINSTIPFGLALAAIGLSIGFAQVYHWEVVESVRPAGSATSAQAWLWTMEGATLALGTAIGGYLVEHLSPQVARAGVTVALLTSMFYIWTFAAPRLGQANQPLSDVQQAESVADAEMTIP